MEGLLYESNPVRRFLGLKITDALTDKTTILNFRHLLERHGLGKRPFEEINRHMESQGLRMREGTILDASIIDGPSSTKNRAGEWCPEIHQTKKEGFVHFGMKLRIGVDWDTGLAHSKSATSANVHDVTEAYGLLHGTRRWCGVMPGIKRDTSGRTWV